MSDFHQTGLITTLHRLRAAPLAELERELAAHVPHQPVSLVLPCLASELQGPALKRIVETLAGVDYLQQVVVSVSGTREREEFEDVRRAFAPVRGATCVWGSGPGVGALLAQLRRSALEPGDDGKGRAVWIGMAYALARGDSSALVFHDCDIESYDREFLARLCLPVVHPRLGYDYVKGYYSRVTDRLYGRVTRLLVTPLLRSLRRILGPLPLLEFLDSFRYPLAGEFGMTASLARQVRIPDHWGLEVGLMAEVFRNTSPQRVCQVELCDHYEHKHRELSHEDPTRGLSRMVIDIATALYHNLASVGVQFDAGFLNTLCATYLRQAQDTVSGYADVALINGLAFDQHDEERMVETFTSGLRIAGLRFVRDPLPPEPVPNWHRVLAALPRFPDELRRAVHADASSPTSPRA
jgi:glucosyl-3-phosphoglycerate synthase